MEPLGPYFGELRPPDANATGFQNGPQSSPVKLDLRWLSSGHSVELDKF